ncbi:unnamed protein product [Rotaria magnacalcarata]|uniref:G-protein coupled receptors family 1 profile domain-containing protein n=1 Tax=Rotaria magnacalcarata TaxID=392030 RepID=A0A814E737_9BILA|nr:unnamed protein product [Rotaria magnacalcarata]CAF1663823.1 unnamed protein product [Rotaria magnacalcarata]CAF2130317.1 unnamed protein product [Rotaria magnacalcarata]CAF4869848.1 unnamed protein product [Rotaria magnacalcarata]CAF4882242.1 unnamed protein product [Rotaria magnacalcarata]
MFWLFIGEVLFSVSLFLIAWTAVERYILIFRNRWVSTSKKWAFVHYFPLACLNIYLLVFYSFIILFPPCENTFDYDQSVCRSPECYYDISLAGIWDTVFNDILPIVVIVIFNMVLFFRVIIGKRCLVQQIQ